jgi:hypothetical protein
VLESGHLSQWLSQPFVFLFPYDKVWRRTSVEYFLPGGDHNAGIKLVFMLVRWRRAKAGSSLPYKD